MIPEPTRSSPGALLRVLVVEDSEDDAELLARGLRKGGYAVQLERVEDAAAMRAALEGATWDLIVSDWTVPGFGALEALAIYRASGLDVPFLVLSGTIGEEKAVEVMRAGAHDFVLKDRVARLVPAVERELAEAARRAEQRALREKLRASEEALARSERLRALGQMAAGISHDIKNILNPISLHLQFMRRAIARNELGDIHESIAEMESVVRRGVQTVERLRDFSRQEPESRVQVVDVNRLVHEAAEIAKPRMASRGSMCRVREELGAAPPIPAHPEEIVSAVVNLVVNAIDAVGSGATILLRTGEARGGAWIEVADDGPGMPPHVAEHVFEPFFTTKGQEGTGLGLAMVYACVKRHGGTVELDTAPDQGARFTLWFPAAPAAGG